MGGFKFELDLKLPNEAPPINASYSERDRELLIAEDQNPAKPQNCSALQNSTPCGADLAPGWTGLEPLVQLLEAWSPSFQIC